MTSNYLKTISFDKGTTIYKICDQELRDKSQILNEGEILKDIEGFNNIKELAHSTFDLSKFTVVGSPTVTEDGIVSNFGNSGNNYIYTNATLPEEGYRTFEIYLGKFKFSSFGNDWMIGNSSNISASIGGFMIRPNVSSDTVKFRIWLGTGSGTWDIVASKDGSINHYNDVNKDIELKLYFDTNQYILYSKIDNNEWETEAVVENSQKIASGIPFYFAPTSSNHNFSIDLKYFEIRDSASLYGADVFNGNKTLIDEIKPVNYSITGAPIIADNGIASGFSDSDYISTNFNFNPSGKWAIEGSFRTSPTYSNHDIIIFKQMSQYGLELDLHNSYNLRFMASSNGTSYDIAGADNYTAVAMVNGTKYYYRLEYNGTTYTLGLCGSNYWQPNRLDVYSPVLIINNSATIQSINVPISFGSYGLNTAFTGKEDLNDFRIYYNDSLVYQPCLFIPYNKSKTHSKTVDKTYLPRVTDMYKQYGIAPYYVLDKANNTYRLPQGDLYGMMSVEQYRNGNSWYRIYPDGWCEQGGIQQVTETTGTISFTHPFRTFNPCIGVIADYANITSFNASSFNYSTTQSSSFTWRAYGYIN